MARDEGNLFVLEGVLVALILLGAAFAIRAQPESSLEEMRPRAELSRLSYDVLVVLDGLDDGNGTDLLERFLIETMHCAWDVAPSPSDCQGRRSRNLSIKLDSYLPLGGGYAIGLGNGLGQREIYRSPLPRGESVGASLMIQPAWNLTFVTTDLSCYDASLDVNATLIPLDRATLTFPTYANVTIAGSETAATPAQSAGWWNVTLPAGSRPASGTIVSNVTGNASLRGATAYGSCALGASPGSVRDAAHATPILATPASVPVGTSTTFQTDLTALQALSGVTVGDAVVTIFEPIPSRGTEPDTWIPTAHVALQGGAVRTGSWMPAPTSLYGVHPALLGVVLDIGGTSVEVLRPLAISVALPTGEVPVAAPYRVSLQTWLSDWG